MNSIHQVADHDKARIRCQDDRWHRDCPRPAEICEHVQWDTGNTKGISFFYYCTEHYQEHVNNREADARLLDAAPDLLAALKDLQREVHDYRLLDVRKRFSLCTADAQAGTAIAKAEGK